MSNPQILFLITTFFALLSGFLVEASLRVAANYRGSNQRNPAPFRVLLRSVNKYHQHLESLVDEHDCTVPNTRSIGRAISYYFVIHSFALYTQMLSLFGTLIFFSIARDNVYWMMMSLGFVLIWVAVMVIMATKTEEEYKKYHEPVVNKKYAIRLKNKNRNKFAIILIKNVPPLNSILFLSRCLVFMVGIYMSFQY